MAGENHERPQNLNAAEARERLERGNGRFRAGQVKHPRADAGRREELTGGQHPFAAIITCADSRVAPELIFDMGLGDLFVVRVAGNIVDDAILGSIEFAAQHVGVNLFVVMGHESCGAVKAAVANVDALGPATHNHLDSLINAIRPAVRNAQVHGNDDLLERSAKENAKVVAEAIRHSEPVMAGLCWKDVKVLSAYYELGSGEVHWLD